MEEVRNKVIELAFAAVVLYAVPYSVAFAFLNSYFASFGITFQETGIGQSETISRVVDAIGEILTYLDVSSVELVVVLSLSVALFYLLHRLRWLILPKVGLPFAVVGIFLIWIGLLSIASKAGYSAAGRASELMQTVAFRRNDLLPPIPEGDLNANSEATPLLRLSGLPDRLIYASSQTYFILRQVSKDYKPVVMRVPRSEEVILIAPVTWSLR